MKLTCPGKLSQNLPYHGDLACLSLIYFSLYEIYTNNNSKTKYKNKY